MFEYSLALPVAHLLVGLYFVFFGFWNIYHWRPLAKIMVERKIPSPVLLLSIGITWQILWGFFIIFGVLINFSAIALMGFVIIATLIFHPFWKFSGELRRLNLIIFITNFTVIIGSLLLLMY